MSFRYNHSQTYFQMLKFENYFSHFECENPKKSNKDILKLKELMGKDHN